MIENPVACIKLGDNKRSILGSPAYQGNFTRLFHCNFSDKIMTSKKKKKKGKENYLVIIDAIRQGLQKIFPQVNKNLFDLFESLPHVLANSRENNTNKSYINYFIKWQK